MSDAKTAMLKFAQCSEILEAAQVLHRHGLIQDNPASFVKRFVEANPDINAFLGSQEAANAIRGK